MTREAWEEAAKSSPEDEPVTPGDTFPKLLDFIPLVSPQFSRPDHLGDWCAIIMQCVGGGVRGICSIPIRHFKTESTIHGIAWLLCMDPTIQIIYMVADERMANDRANRIRLVCSAAAARFGKRIGPEKGQNVKTSWKNEYGGGVQTMSAKQSRQGSDVDVLIFDDPIDEDDVFLPEIRERVDMAIALYTGRAGRVGRRGSAIGVMSRWHPDDPIGRRLVRVAQQWESIVHPAITINDNGEEVAFAPAVMPIEELRLRRAEFAEVDPTERVWYANFQNDPLPDGLGLFRSPARYSSLPIGSFRTILGADLSYSPSRRADYFALVALKIYVEQVVEDGRTITAEMAYVANAWREKWDPAQSEQILRMARGMYPGAVLYSYMSGPEIGIAHYLAEKGIPIQVMPARYSKRQRAQKTIDKSNAGRIRFPEQAPWVSGMIARMILFTGDDKAGNDDEIDALVSAVDGGMTGMVGTPRALGKRRI